MGDELLALAERCEKATGRDDRLALEIARATNTVINAAPIGADGRGVEHYPDFTASLDAAMTLGVPRHIEWCDGAVEACCFSPDEFSSAVYTGRATTPALALCAAALRALSENRTEL